MRSRRAGGRSGPGMPDLKKKKKNTRKEAPEQIHRFVSVPGRLFGYFVIMPEMICEFLTKT